MKHYKPFRFKQFLVEQNNAAMKVGTDSVLLGSWARINPFEHVLDIGTGTGLLSLMLAQKVEGQCTIDAIEIDESAIIDARKNFKNSKWNTSINLINQDFNSFETKGQYDVIISNPPFFEGLAPSVFTRSIARNASDKLSYENLIKGASKLLVLEGRFYLIIPNEYYAKVIIIATSNNLSLNNQLNIKPKANKPINRILVELVKKRTNRTTTNYTEELIIRNDSNNYTVEHKILTKSYYLELT